MRASLGLLTLLYLGEDRTEDEMLKLSASEWSGSCAGRPPLSATSEFAGVGGRNKGLLL